MHVQNEAHCVDGATELAADCAKEMRPELLTPVDPNPPQPTRSALSKCPSINLPRTTHMLYSKLTPQISERTKPARQYIIRTDTSKLDLEAR